MLRLKKQLSDELWRKQAATMVDVRLPATTVGTGITLHWWDVARAIDHRLALVIQQRTPLIDLTQIIHSSKGPKCTTSDLFDDHRGKLAGLTVSAVNSDDNREIMISRAR